jgi:hypothetical protein
MSIINKIVPRLYETRLRRFEVKGLSAFGGLKFRSLSQATGISEILPPSKRIVVPLYQKKGT